jgi:hypothetical protein
MGVGDMNTTQWFGHTWSVSNCTVRLLSVSETRMMHYGQWLLYIGGVTYGALVLWREYVLEFGWD